MKIARNVDELFSRRVSFLVVKFKHRSRYRLVSNIPDDYSLLSRSEVRTKKGVTAIGYVI